MRSTLLCLFFFISTIAALDIFKVVSPTKDYGWLNLSGAQTILWSGVRESTNHDEIGIYVHSNPNRSVSYIQYSARNVSKWLSSHKFQPLVPLVQGDQYQIEFRNAFDGTTIVLSDTFRVGPVLSLITPSLAKGWTTTGPQLVQWESTTTVPVKFDIELTNATSNSTRIIISELDAISGNYTYTAPESMVEGQKWRVSLESHYADPRVEGEVFEVKREDSKSSALVACTMQNGVVGLAIGILALALSWH